MTYWMRLPRRHALRVTPRNDHEGHLPFLVIARPALGRAVAISFIHTKAEQSGASCFRQAPILRRRPRPRAPAPSLDDTVGKTKQSGVPCPQRHGRHGRRGRAKRSYLLVEDTDNPAKTQRCPCHPAQGLVFVSCIAALRIRSSSARHPAGQKGDTPRSRRAGSSRRRRDQASMLWARGIHSAKRPRGADAPGSPATGGIAHALLPVAPSCPSW